MEFLNDNFDWLENKMAERVGDYFIIDFPGQLELFLNTDSLRELLAKLKNSLKLKFRLTAVELFDSHYIQDPSKFLSACTYSLMTMINLGLPHINVLSKIDLLNKVSDLDFKIDYYLDCTNFDLLKDNLNKGNTKFSVCRREGGHHAFDPL